MSTIRVVRGVGRAGTAMASYDAALADANVHNYNLVAVSSVIPAEATVDLVETAPDLGPAGNRLTVVQSRATARAGTADRVCAGVGWTTGPGPGLFYEASGNDPDRVRDTIEHGLEEGRALREWAFDAEEVALATGEVPDRHEHGADTYTTAVVLAAYGESEPIL
ncbi:pyruvoyl-dependent arginine decarboxylase subunit alpha [Salinigranum rubrum]|uniref:arginine decarboxylase n=1 Tax=Salinigranum rubrum TaxID=755307 RepID=A0A2I8VP72_9EURY|nr:pyruvoyl-dependent arginine decarboxylase [Salinigranum rubrum]AUV83727.1 pyruvoyl-dependent arginine decarboxylase subunit alpha [Salinigranum rubrum]